MGSAGDSPALVGDSPTGTEESRAGEKQVSPKQRGDLLQNKAIIVSHGTWNFTSNDTAVLNYTLDFYLPSADADGHGFPDAGVQPVLILPTVDNAKRVPIL